LRLTEDPIEYRIVRINEWFLSDYIVVKRYDDRNVTCSVEEMAHRTERKRQMVVDDICPCKLLAQSIRERRTDRCRFDVPRLPGTNDLRSVILVDAARPRGCDVRTRNVTESIPVTRLRTIFCIPSKRVVVRTHLQRR